jgi:hypothetical protein
VIRPLLCLLCALTAFGWLGCHGPEDEHGPGLDIRRRDVTWPTYDGRFSRPPTELAPAEPEQPEEPAASPGELY